MTAETIQTPLVESWVYEPRYAPEPAWGEPNPRPVGGWHGLTEMRRVHFDDAFHVAISNENVYFGSSADGRVLCLDLSTGQQRWSALTGGPVRLAPSVWQNNVYVGSDDGFVYCLDGSSGDERWKYRAAPYDRKVLGSGKMISLWPVRTGVLVDEGKAFFGAGIFPAEGVYMYAVDASDGKLVWCNDTGGSAPQSRISPQGYLLASNDRLFTPLGRVSPAAYDRKDGRLLYETYVEHIIGGTNATLADDQMFTGTEQMIGYDQASNRARSSWFWSHQLIVTPDVFYSASGTELLAVKRGKYEAASLSRKSLLDRKRDLTTELNRAKQGPKTQLEKVQAQMDALNRQIADAESKMAAGQIWRVECDCDETLALAGNVIIAGGDKKVLAFDAVSGKLLWTGIVDGTARGLAVTDNRLIVSCDTGRIYCFGGPASPTLGVIQQPVNPRPFPTDNLTSVIEAAAEEIVKTTGIDRGYCLVLGCGTGRLAFELANRTDLHICAVEPDPKKAESARRALEAAGLYGARVTIVQSDLSTVPFSDYFANLIVSEDAVVSGRMPGDARDAFRMLKPLGGTICIGQPATANGKVPPLEATTMQAWLTDVGLDGGRLSDDNGQWLVCTRGSLPGAGSWTHQYAEPGNSTCSDDQLIRCPLGVLWFGNPGPGQMAERHRRAASPLAVNGRLFVQGEGTANRIGLGENSVMAYDAYNGIKLWDRKILGALRVTVTHDSGNWAANDDSLFVAVDDGCMQLDAATGDTRHTFQVPPAADAGPHKWGFVAVAGDLLYGSRTIKGRTAECVFAFDIATGRLVWKHEVGGIGQGSIAIGDGRVFFATSQVTEDQRELALSSRVKEVHLMTEAERAALLKRLEKASIYNVVALNAQTGDLIWEKPVEVTGAAGGAYWCSLGAIYKDDLLVLFGVFLDGHYWTQFLAGQFETRQVVAVSGQDGETVWRKPIGYRVRPIVVGNTLHAEPWAYDLKTGEQQSRVHPITGRSEPWQFARPGHHCGAPAASPHMLLFRSYNLGWYDLDYDYGTQHFGAQRPGCWINFIPANGLVMMPEASSGCMCPFPNTCSIVFANSDQNRQWAYFSQPGSMTPVKHLALNLNAPGDRKDSSGTLWLGYPRPGGSLVLQYQLDVSFYPGWSYFRHDPAKLNIAGTDQHWVFRSGVSGMRQCTIPLAEAVDGKARYTVRLAFAELEHDTVGQRVFDIKIQGQVVAKSVDVFQEAGGKNRPLFREFKGIDADEELKIEFVANSAKPTKSQLPIVQGIEVQREQVLSLGLSAPSFQLSNALARQAGEVIVVNNRDEDFAGTLRVQVPDGFTIAPADTSLQVAAGKRATIMLQAAIGPDAKTGQYPLTFELVRPDGTIENRQQAILEHLGNRRRVVVKVAEDAHVTQAAPTANNGSNRGLNVDGGDRQMGDQHHGISYLKFRLKLAGTPVSAKLRLYNGDNPTGNSGNIRLVTEPWSEKSVTYNTRPELGDVAARIGAVSENQIIEIPLDLSLQGVQELNLAIDPTGCDGINYISREGGKPAELIVEYVE